MRGRNLCPAGDLGILVELSPSVSFSELHGATAAARRINGVRACIVGHASLYLIFDSGEPFFERSRRVEEQLRIGAAESISEGRTLRIRVSIHPECAPDLDRLLSAASIDRDTFEKILASLQLRARYLGFRPGFAYLEGLPPQWSLPRLAQPRIRVPAGSLGIAGNLAAFYPSESPGGWNLIGRSADLFWDPRRNPPNLIAPGDEIHLVPTTEKIVPRVTGPLRSEEGIQMAEVLRAGQLTLIVGGSDPDRYSMGLPIGGPFDQPAAAAANLAVGNASDETLLECTLVGPELRFMRSCTVAWYGAPTEILRNQSKVQDPGRFEVQPGDVVTIGRLQSGLRGYLAVSGGFSNPVSRYELAPAAVRHGSALFCKSEPSRPGESSRLRRDDPFTIRALEGPHPVEPDEIGELQDQWWEVTPALDRTGIRLRGSGPAIEQRSDLSSWGMQFGTVQWHPNGELVIMGPDHPITGGYRQPLTVVSTERWKLAQLAPGDRVRWRIEKST